MRGANGSRRARSEKAKPVHRGRRKGCIGDADAEPASQEPCQRFGEQRLAAHVRLTLGDPLIALRVDGEVGVVRVRHRHPSEARDAGDERDHGAPGSDPADGGAWTFARVGIEPVYRDRPCRHSACCSGEAPSTPALRRPSRAGLDWTDSLVVEPVPWEPSTRAPARTLQRADQPGAQGSGHERPLASRVAARSSLWPGDSRRVRRRRVAARRFKYVVTIVLLLSTDKLVLPSLSTRHWL